MKITSFFLALFIIFSINGCAPKSAMIKVDQHIAKGEYQKAALSAQENLDEGDIYGRNNLLWKLESGSAFSYNEDYNRSIKALDDSEILMRYFREQILAKDISQTLSSLLVNDTTRPYIGTEYDGIMANTYKAIDYMAKGDMDSARVEFNRAIDRQRRAKIFFSKMIQKEQKAIKQKELESADEGKNLSVSNEIIDEKLLQNYPSLHNFKAYPDFVNPTSTYLAALFAKANNDKSKADFLLKEAYGMMQKNEDVKADFLNKNYDKTVWLIFENGQAPVLEEWRVDFPIWIYSSSLSYISLALPKLIERETAWSYLNINLDQNRTIKTKFLSSMDRVIKTEFEKSYDSTVRRAILSAATKTAINYALEQNSNGSNGAELVRFIAAVYQMASTQADTRIWSTLPKEFQLARFERPFDGVISITTPNNTLVKNITLPDAKNILIYVKIATPNALASVRVIPF